MSSDAPEGDAADRAVQQAWQGFRQQWPETRSVDLVIPDLVGIARGKRLPIDDFEGALKDGLSFPSSVYALDTTGCNVDASGLVWEEGDADRPVLIDPSSFRPVSWQAQGAQAFGSLLDHDGTPFFADPRSALKRVIERLADNLGVKPVVALELEFYLLAAKSERDGRARMRRSDLGDEAAVQVYNLDALDHEHQFFSILDQYCAEQAIPAKAASAEYASGQFEVNLGHSDQALLAADHGFMLKRAVKAAAREVGARATFMAKPFAEQAANGLHIHVSLVDQDQQNLFATDEQKLRHAIGGLQATMAEAMLIFAPNANSFRRLKPRSYAPVASTWGYNNRTVALRIPAGSASSRRIEHRVAGADANPYLALAAVLAGLHHGLVNEIDPGEPITGNAYEKVAPNLPISWDRALDRMVSAELLPEYLGADLCRLYHVCRLAERDRYHDVVPPLDYSWYQHNV